MTMKVTKMGATLVMMIILTGNNDVDQDDGSGDDSDSSDG